MSRGHLAEKQGRAFLSGECFSKAWEDQAWKEEFGTLLELQLPWAIVWVDSCQYDEGPSSKPREGSHYWLSNFDLRDLGLRCQKPDALGRLGHKHCTDPTHFPSQRHLDLGVQFFSCLGSMV